MAHPHAGPGWLFLIGLQADITLIRKKLGLYFVPDSATVHHGDAGIL